MYWNIWTVPEGRSVELPLHFPIPGKAIFKSNLQELEQTIEPTRLGSFNLSWKWITPIQYVADNLEEYLVYWGYDCSFKRRYARLCLWSGNSERRQSTHIVSICCECGEQLEQYMYSSPRRHVPLFHFWRMMHIQVIFHHVIFPDWILHQDEPLLTLLTLKFSAALQYGEEV